MLSAALSIAGPLVFSLAVCLFALTKGDAPERFGAAVILANMLAATIFELAWRSQIALLAIDALTAVLLLVIAVRYASFWLGAVMLLYALQFALHAFYFVAERPRDALHVVLNNLDFFTVCVCLAAGTAVAWRRRRRLALVPALG
jgi:signal transduction histidine kinase